MTASVSIKRYLLLVVLLPLLSCAGSQGGGSGGTGSPAVASGSVTGFGSIFVNGTEFDTTDAAITIDGQPATEADLQLGQVVTIEGTRDASGATGRATTVTFNKHAEGAIEHIDVDTNSLTVLGQRIFVTNQTQFGDTPFDDLVVGNIVALSGFEDANGDFRATWLNKTQDAFTPDVEIEATGTVANLDAMNQTFTLNMLTVDFSDADLSDVPGGQLIEGQVVAVTSSQNVVDGILLADRVDIQQVGLQGEAGDDAELQGIVTQIVAPDTFEVNGQVVRITSETIFEKGTVDDLALNVLVELEGVFDANGVIIAAEVEYAAGDELRGTITSGLSGDTFEVNEQVIRITEDTRIHPNAVDDLLVGVQVEVEGFFNTDGVLVATEIELFLEGSITDIINDSTFEINGQVIRITSNTVFDPGTATNIEVGAEVEVEGFFDENNIFIATEIEFL